MELLPLAVLVLGYVPSETGGAAVLWLLPLLLKCGRQDILTIGMLLITAVSTLKVFSTSAGATVKSHDLPEIRERCVKRYPITVRVFEF